MVIVSNPRTFKVGLQALRSGVCLREPREIELCAGRSVSRQFLLTCCAPA